jgi:hypothetical protein
MKYFSMLGLDVYDIWKSSKKLPQDYVSP